MLNYVDVDNQSTAQNRTKVVILYLSPFLKIWMHFLYEAYSILLAFGSVTPNYFALI